MGILSRIFAPATSAQWEVAPGGVLWKLLPTTNGTLVGEARDTEKRTMDLFAVRADTGELLYRGVRLDEPWWIAMESTVGSITLLHRFPHPDLPTARGLVAIDSNNGNLLWEDRDLRLVAGVEEIALVQRGSNGSYAFIDARSGTILEETTEDSDRVHAFLQATSGDNRWDGWMNSSAPQPSSEEEREALGLLSERLKGGTAIGLETARYGAWFAITAHAPSVSPKNIHPATPGYDTHFILARNGRIEHHELLLRNAEGISSDIFFIWHGIAIVIRERTRLAGFDLRHREH